MTGHPLEPTSTGTAAVPVCPRHPDRESYVRCQRCDRPTCPQCQRPAAVGVQCVDCVREQAASVPTARTAFGGAVTGGRPLVTTVVVVACVLAYLAERVPGSQVLARFAYVPSLTLAEPWRLVTAAFLHDPGSILHIAFNMYALWLTGSALEPLLGRARFAALYLLSALGGSIGYFVLASPLSQAWGSASVGASGAVFGLFGAYVVVSRHLGTSAGPMVATIAINAVIGFLVPGIAWQAHLGGLVTGVLVALVLARAPRSRRTPVQVAGTVGVALVLAALLVAKVAWVSGSAVPGLLS